MCCFFHKDRILGQLDNFHVENFVKFVDPENVGYNIADCEYVFAPAVQDEHWFCYVFVKKELTVYLLDSLLPNNNSPAGAKALQAKREQGQKVVLEIAFLDVIKFVY